MVAGEVPIKKTVAEPVIRFLRGLLYDGELSSDEVWSLGNWLNKQERSVLEEWPANLLVPLLRDVFADGELTAEEMQQVAVTLVAIEDKWISTYAKCDDPIPNATPPAPRSSIIHESCDISKLPVAGIIEEVESMSSDGTYIVNLNEHTCTCGDWVSKRRKAPIADYKRVCKHIAHLLHFHRIGDQVGDPLFSAFAEDHALRQAGTNPHDSWYVETTAAGKVLYGFSQESDWINLFARQGSSIQRFGFNRRERRWSYGESPRGFAQFARNRFASP